MIMRTATDHDTSALRRLAGLDSARPLVGRVLMAERDGVPVAAVSLANGAALADPFQPSADAVRALRLRRYQLLRQSQGVGPAWLLLRRLALRLVPSRSGV